MKTKEGKSYDVVIIGAGPAAMGAALYAARYNMKVLVIGKKLGGMMTEAHLIENYPGVPPMSGMELANKFKENIEKLGVETRIGPEVAGLEKNKHGFIVMTKDNDTIKTKAIIIAVGTEKRKMNMPGEKEYLGKGISYCYTCDGPLFRDKVVGVVGGANSAALAAIALSEYAKKVFMMYRRDKLRCDPIYLERIKRNKKIEIIYGVVPEKVEGSQLLESVTLKKSEQTKLGKVKAGKLSVQGLFIEIGEVPLASIAKQVSLKLSKNGFIVVDNDMNTNVPGVFAAGDITTGSLEFRQIITAAAEGAVAARSAFDYVGSLKTKR
jgi:thioredoxin reductase (NADPH)